MWYVIQVQTGRESAARDLIEQTAGIAEAEAEAVAASAAPCGERDACSDSQEPAPPPAPGAGTMSETAARTRLHSDKPLLEECFVPRYRTARKRGRVWESCEDVLFPGYLIAATARVDDLAALLRRVPAFTQIIGKTDNAFIPLNPDEVAWIDAFTHQGHRVVEMSTGVVEGERVTVIDGPLVGREGLIRKVNHRKKLAYLELSMFGRTIQTQVGLRVLRKRPEQKA